MHSTNTISRLAMLRGAVADGLGVLLGTSMPRGAERTSPRAEAASGWKSVVERAGRQLAFLLCLGTGCVR